MDFFPTIILFIYDIILIAKNLLKLVYSITRVSGLNKKLPTALGML